MSRALVDTLSDADVAELEADGWKPAPCGGPWWRDPQSGRNYLGARALELCRRDRAAAAAAAEARRVG